MYKIDELIAKLQSSLTEAKEASRIGKESNLPADAVKALDETESKIQKTLNDMISLAHQRGAEEPFTVRKKPLDPSRKREQNS
jgi:hypothetical protein